MSATKLGYRLDGAHGSGRGGGEGALHDVREILFIPGPYTGLEESVRIGNRGLLWGAGGEEKTTVKQKQIIDESD